MEDEEFGNCESCGAPLTGCEDFADVCMECDRLWDGEDDQP